MTRNEVRPTANTEWRGSTISLRFASVQSWTMRGGAETASDPGANDSRGRYPQSAPLQNGLGVARLWGRPDGRRRPRFFPASDRTPSDVLPLSFLGKGCDGASAPLADQIRGRLQSFLASDAKKADVSYHLAACLEFNRLESRPGHPSRISSEARPRSSRSSIMAMRISNSEFRRPLSASTQKQPKNVRGAQNNSRLCQYSLPSRASLSAVRQLCPRTRGVRQLRAAQ